MLRFLIKRISQSIFVILGVSIVIFVISRLVPGDPARLALGPAAPQFAVDQLRQEMHLDEALPVQYYHWFGGVLKGDFGRSINTKRPIIEDIKEFFPVTLELILFSGVLIIFFSIILGLLAIGFRDTWIDGTIRVVAYIGVATPAFVIGTILILFFGYIWPVLPVLGRLGVEIVQPEKITGMLIIDSLIEGNLPAFFDSIKRLLLPSCTLSLALAFGNARIFRSALADKMRKDYISVSIGYGIPRTLILRKYLLKPSSIPLISSLGFCLPNLFGVAFIVETIFLWPGMSRYGMNAMLSKDLNTISAVVIITGIAFSFTNIIVDILTASIDPRVRLGGK